MKSTSGSATSQARWAYVLRHFEGMAVALDRTDGLSVEFPDWRFNLRGSNTEPLLRLNVESRREPARLSAAVAEIAALIKAVG